MSTATLISVEEYLKTGYPDGDREYVDGVIVERNLGTIDHGDCQSGMLFYLKLHHKELWTAVEIRVQVKPTRFRIPDVVCARKPKPEGAILRQPPFLVIEVLSPDDRAEYIQEKIDDYLSFGTQYIWVVNPRARRGFVYTQDGMREAKDGILRTANPDIALPLAEIL
jgi:Uma2 family endonuclease